MAGGYRPNSGRKSQEDEINVRQLARSAIIKKWGSLEAGLEALLSSKEPSLMKFVTEHAFGKAPDILQHSGSLEMKVTIDRS